MDSSTDLPLLIVAECLFVALVACVVWSQVLRKRLKRARLRLTQLVREKASLNAQVADLEARLRQQAKQFKDAEQATERERKSIASFKQRIANLERYKTLYLELEQRLEDMEESPPSGGDSDHIAMLQGVIETQNQAIADLRGNLDDIREKYQLETAVSQQLTENIDNLEKGMEKLAQELDHARRQRALAEKQAVELGVYKDQTQRLEKNEKRLQETLNDYRAQLEKGPHRDEGKSPYGAVQVREISELSGRLQDRESEIVRLRKECETIALQYEELAMRSLEKASENDDLTDDQKAQLQELKQKLEENSAALARKQAECEMLENSYLELESRVDLEQASNAMNQAFDERNELRAIRHDLNEEIETTCNIEASEEIQDMHRELVNREGSLEDIRDDYRDLKAQFVEIALEDAELREENMALKQECEKLNREVRRLRELQFEAIDESSELESLRDEYNKLEGRYLKLLEKFRGND